MWKKERNERKGNPERGGGGGGGGGGDEAVVDGSGGDVAIDDVVVLLSTVQQCCSNLLVSCEKTGSVGCSEDSGVGVRERSRRDVFVEWELRC
jgi:hypothetical protein